jgi:hypothetical protein
MNLPSVQYDVMQLEGGLDQVTPTLSLRSGLARRAANFECSINGGYTRIQGYERFDGRPNPSDATYTILTCDLVSPVAVGDTVTGDTSLATAKVFATGSGFIVVTKEVGFFSEDENIKIGSTVVGVITDVAGVAADGLQDVEYKWAAAEEYRQDIGAVPGYGPIRGVSYYKGTVYAWRGNEASTATVMYKSSASGWQAVPLFSQFDFDKGAVEFFPGDTINGQTSGATALIKAVIVTSGSWSAGTATGYALFTDQVGVPTDGENIRVGGVKVAEYLGGASAIAFAPNGRVETVIGNLGGGPGNLKMYGADGVNRAFEFDGDVLIPIRTGMAIDTPTHVSLFKQHLFLSFGYSLQFSAIANPYSFSPLLGAGELAMNADITNLLVLPGDQSSGALGVYTRNDTSVLYGTSAEDFRLSTFNSGTGAIAYTAQMMDSAYVLDDRGALSLSTAQNFGNFDTASLTLNIRPYIQFRRNLATASSVNREKGQYRIFFSDGAAVYITINNGRLLGSMPIQFNHPATCCVEGETPDGSDTAFFGSINGFVYRLDAGTSFDGEEIQANMSLVFNSVRSPRLRKRYRRASIEMTGDSYAQINFNYDLGYRSIEIEQPDDRLYDGDLRKSYWDSLQWDNFVFDSRELAPTEVEVVGTAENIAINLSSVSKLFKPFTVNSIILHFSIRRGLR